MKPTSIPAVSGDELAIARTVVYASLFDYPLTLEQLHETLLESSLSAAEILETFRTSPTLRSIIEHRDGFFFPAGRHALVAERRDREARSRTFLERHRRLLSLVCAVPYTRLVALSGSIAHMNLEGDGDLDLFIVTRGPHVWSVAVAVLLIAKLLGSRRILCANFLIADSHLAVGQDDVFTANQMIHLKPLVGADLYEALLAGNPCVRRYYPNFRARGGVSDPRIDVGSRFIPVKTILERLLIGPAWVAEIVCRFLYARHLRRRASSWRSPDEVQLQAAYLKLHSQSHKRIVLDRFDRAVSGALDRASNLQAVGAAAGRTRW
jgi:hypothetical protein